MFHIRKLLSTNIIRHKSNYDFNKSFIIDKDIHRNNKIIKYSYKYNINQINTDIDIFNEYYEIDFLRDTLKLKTGCANTIKDFDKISYLIDFHKKKNNIIELNNPNLENIILNDDIYYKDNTTFIINNLSLINYKYIDILKNRLFINSYLIESKNDAQFIIDNFDNIIDIFQKNLSAKIKNNEYDNCLNFNCFNIKYPILPNLILKNRGICDSRFVNFNYEYNETINTIDEVKKLLENLDYVNDVLRYIYRDHCSLINAIIQHQFKINITGKMANNLNDKKILDELKLFDYPFRSNLNNTCFKFNINN